MWFRVLKDHTFQDQRGKPLPKQAGQLVEVLNRHTVQSLLASGIIGHKIYSFQMREGYSQAAEAWAKTKRVGIWLFTSSHYSGGRVHLYQYAHCLAEAGAEVWLITGAQPKWARDYPKCDRLHVVIEGKAPIPPDLDMIVTDSKESIGHKAHHWKLRHPRAIFVCFNFETPNWVNEFDQDYAGRLKGTQWKASFEAADFLLANSKMSMEWMLKWLGKKTPANDLPPAVNTYALDRASWDGIQRPRHPYAVWCARPAQYKGVNVALSAVHRLEEPFDLVVIGTASNAPKDTSAHRTYVYRGIPDSAKFALIRDARMVLAPSKFEGFGMIPMEALASGTPCIVYDLPVLRQNYGDRLIYVRWGDKNAYKQEVLRACTTGKPDMSKEQAWARKVYGLDAMRERIELLPYHAVKRQSITAHLIALWGVFPEALESVYPYVDEILVAHGATELTKDWAGGDSLKTLREFPDPDGKITIEHRAVWQDKREMRNWCATRARGNYMLMLDGDEIWTGMEAWLAAGMDFGCPRWVNFWHTGKHWILDNGKLAGHRWGYPLEPFGSVCPHYRWSWWRRSYYFRKHPMPVDHSENPICHLAAQRHAAEAVPEAVIYHLGHALPKDVMERKHRFYLERDGAGASRQKRRTAWRNWKGKEGDCGDGVVKRVNWEVPEIVQRALARIGHGAGCEQPVLVGK